MYGWRRWTAICIWIYSYDSCKVWNVSKRKSHFMRLATTTEGIFRLSGSAKRIKELQTIFDSPPSYGKTLTWMGYSVHDAANILRRYLNHLPDPVIPHQWYEQFRSVHDTYGNTHKRVHHYQKLIAKLPKENQHLLLYILDLLAVFSSKSGQNLMSAKNLASIFQPGILSHPDHDMAPEEYKLSQEVLEFLIDYQNYFLMPGGQENNMTTISNNKEAQAGNTKRDIRSSLSLEHRSKSTDSITMLSDVNNEQDTNEDLKRRQDQDTTSTPLVRENTTSGLIRSKTLPSKRPKYEGAQKRNDGTQTTPTTGGSNDIDKEDKKSKKRQSLVQLAPLITLPKGSNNDRAGKSSRKSRKKSLSISSISSKTSKRTSRYNKSGTSGNIEPINISSVSSSVKGGPSSPKSISSPKSLTSPSSLSGKKLVDVMSDEKENSSITSSSNSSVIKRRKRGDKKGKNIQETQGELENNGKERMNFLLELRKKMWFGSGNGGNGGSGGSSIGSRNSMVSVGSIDSSEEKTLEHLRKEN
ncbi:hypothetical protein RclHR1_04710013 [Rhizophagus clarus]|uniref:Rho-GAP domain-containing protein n=1 Tax=Rhizophagus clarus TaxID=94130 RepID=A0A2Z6RW82_9GLOM|nr:hypothetical protein RclHR1_04710013 [Rhizophagus clarus]